MPAPKKSVRPKARDPKKAAAAAAAKAVSRGNKGSKYNASDLDTMPPKKKACGGKVTKKAGGGMCRGMGAATKGGSYGKMG